jgi:ADP-ribose pyrophosphatase YjhB (NUDIX family)
VSKPRIRQISLCVFSNQGRILVFEGYDYLKPEKFYRPLGGGIHFGETALSAMIREIREELKAEIDKPRQLGVLESIYFHNGLPGHEIVFVFDACFKDTSLYQKAQLPAFEDDHTELKAIWIDLASQPASSIPLYPDGLYGLLRKSKII